MKILTLKSGKQAPFSLSESAQYDYENGASDKITGWGRICKELHKKNQSKKNN